ncbi:hypothetical protein BABINDRAFT_162523 [Babjeviella inositovora NRRL Y-12698]|uniref:Pirin n=1 Tax=Babjeviella inositovora NRRL Y-12698 TaxID=984486 RepID=A0A1E3QMJ5_9ASCO|nr:uncharacterized protein BABINDRAFT_162523 [Babjeviella inositovora NRRL Y-12698]ODQ78848.1 hypothetical protein BABINDRAFT_162523 [Babjeviella inositovora NRRL Y-12698]
MVAPRSILKSVLAIEQAEGVGARVRRTIGTMAMRNFTPFLMLDHFNIDPKAGFPDHPHRGQETITYMMSGEFAHNDFTGASGILRLGDLQFMTAGRGIVHAEMPIPLEDGTPILGMQLWVDLPAELKECEPRYRDLRAAEIPIAKPNDKVTIKVISGESYGVKSVQDLAYTPVEYYDYEVAPGGSFEQKIPEDFNAFLYILSGPGLTLDGTHIKHFNTVFFKRDGEGIVGSVPEGGDEKTRFVIIAGKVLDQPIVQHGPFVETSKDKIYKAFDDYLRSSNGFERAKNWSSKIGGGVTASVKKDLLEAEKQENEKAKAH